MAIENRDANQTRTSQCKWQGKIGEANGDAVEARKDAPNARIAPCGCENAKAQ